MVYRIRILPLLLAGPALIIFYGLVAPPALAQFVGGSWNKGSTTRLYFDGCSHSSTQGSLNGYVGNCSDDANASNATVGVNIGLDEQILVIGGFTAKDSANANTVHITNSTLGHVYGGYKYSYSSGQSASVSHNTVVIKNSTVGNVRGGVGRRDATVDHNSVTLDATTAGKVIGGIGPVSASSNKVIIKNNSHVLYGEVIGGQSYDGAVKDNEVVITDSRVDADIVGGDARNSSHPAQGNIVRVTNSRVEYLWGGESEGEAFDNLVVIAGSDTVVDGEVFGGHSNRTDLPAHDNRVEISGGKITDWAYGGGGRFADNAHDNSVIMTGGTIDGGNISIGVAGGYSDENASGNQVELSGDAKVVGTIAAVRFSFAPQEAKNNRVVIAGTPDLAASTLYGFYVNPRRADPSHSFDRVGNVLEIRSKGLTALNVKNFDAYHFLLPGDIQPDETVLALTGGTSNEQTDLRAAEIGVALQGGGNVLEVGDQVVLVHNSNGVLTDAAINQASMTGYQGISLQYEFDLSANADNLYATVAAGEPGEPDESTPPDDSGDGDDSDPGDDNGLDSGDGSGMDPGSQDGSGSDDDSGTSLPDDSSHESSIVVREQTKAVVEGRITTLALSLQASDLVAGAGFEQAATATAGTTGLMSFGAASGGSMRYHSGSHVDVNGVSLMAGVASRLDMTRGGLLAGVFLEGGYASYDTYNRFSDGQKVRGGGNAHYFGGGLLLRRDWLVDRAGPYAQGALRMGTVSTEWSSHDLQGGPGSRNARYNTSNLYYGVQLGAGYVQPLADSLALDLSLKYSWTRQDSDSVTIAGDPFKFAAIDSHRTRLGLRLTHDFSDRFVAYVGSAWEHEFDGHARATAYGMDTPTPGLEGDSGVFELGIDITPAANLPLTLGLGVQGYAGKREGVNGVARVAYAF